MGKLNEGYKQNPEEDGTWQC